MNVDWNFEAALRFLSETGDIVWFHEKFKDTIISKIPSARLGEPDDVANAVCFLCSNRSSYINGETLHVNGGMYMA